MAKIRHVFLILILLFTFPFLGKAQKTSLEHPWSDYIITQSDQNKKQETSLYYLINWTEVYDHSTITLIRKLDRSYAIVKIDPKSTWSKKKWSINNQWKVNNQYNSLPSNALSTFYIRTLDEKALSVASSSNLSIIYINEHTL
ncbi:MAG: hypothetical protein ABJH05_01045, partial [Fulvivirga sp.]